MSLKSTEKKLWAKQGTNDFRKGCYVRKTIILNSRGISWIRATSKIEFFLTRVNGWKLWTNITKWSILDISGVPDTSMNTIKNLHYS